MTPASDSSPQMAHIHGRILERVRKLLAQRSYIGTPSEPGPDPEASAALERASFGGVTSPSEVRAQVEELYAQGRIGALSRLEWLIVVASRPDVRDWPEAMRLLGELERLTWDMDDERRTQNLAAIARHRGVVAYLEGHYAVALEYFLDAVNKAPTLPNLHNAICVTLKLSGEEEARGLYSYIQSVIPEEAAQALAERVNRDPDLFPLRRSGGSHDPR